MSIDETLSRSSTIQEMSWKAERTMSIVLAKHLIGVTQHPSTIIVRVVGFPVPVCRFAYAFRISHLITNRYRLRYFDERLGVSSGRTTTSNRVRLRPPAVTPHERNACGLPRPRPWTLERSLRCPSVLRPQDSVLRRRRARAPSPCCRRPWRRRSRAGAPRAGPCASASRAS